MCHVGKTANTLSTEILCLDMFRIHLIFNDRLTLIPQYLRIIHSATSAYGVLFPRCIQIHRPGHMYSYVFIFTSADVQQCEDCWESTTPSLDVRRRCDRPLNITQLLRGGIRCFSHTAFVLQMNSCLFVILAAVLSPPALFFSPPGIAKSCKRCQL